MSILSWALPPMAVVETLKRSRLLRGAGISTLDQVVISLTNFLTGLLLIRSCTPEEYGGFVTANTILLLMIGIHGALVTTPMTIVLPGREEFRRSEFPLGLMTVQGGVLLLASFLLCMVIRLLGNDHDRYPDTLTVVLIVVNGVLLKEFMRMWFYTALKPGIVLLMDFAQGILVMGCLVFLIRAGILNTDTAFWGIGAVSLIVAGVSFLYALKREGTGFTWNLRMIPDILRPGRWAVLGSVATWFQTQGFVHLLLWKIGPAGVAAASVSRLLFTPLTLISSGWGMIYKPWGSRRYGPESRKLVQALLVVTPVLLGIGLVYCGLLLSLHTVLPGLLFGDRYSGLGWPLLMLWSFYFMVQIIRGNITNTLQVLQNFRSLSLFSITGAVVTLSVGYLLIARYGIEGTIVGLVAGEICLTLFCLPRLRRFIRQGLSVIPIPAEREDRGR